MTSPAKIVAPAAAAVEVTGLSRHFGPVRALHEVTLRVPAGSLTAVMGENGAGKSTLMKILAGLDTPTAGTVRVAGEEVRRFDPATLLSKHRVALVPQELSLAQDRTVAENIMLGVEPGPRPFPNRSKLNERAAELLERLGVGLDPRRTCGTSTPPPSSSSSSPDRWPVTPRWSSSTNRPRSCPRLSPSGSSA